ncbi:unnamed protein product [Dracunculus medinensis]|uniref:Vacuolar protein sorting-associated protein 33A n=1 Tax=Dracunculus medinensis TaxID=318479 RepID=A0A158Q564_DRAME|nr:unnamed protein product [Dracunculus medinensis]
MLIIESVVLLRDFQSFPEVRQVGALRLSSDFSTNALKKLINEQGYGGLARVKGEASYGGLARVKGKAGYGGLARVKGEAGYGSLARVKGEAGYGGLARVKGKAGHGGLARVKVESNRSILFNALDSFDGEKIATAELLKEHKVVSMLQLERVQGISLAEHNHVIYILPSSLAVINKLNAFLNEARARKDRHLHHVLFVPDAALVLCDRLKENRETFSMLKTVESLPLRIYPLYTDHFILFMDDMPSKVLLNDDWIEFQKCALALRQMEEIFQCLPNIRCKGKWAAQIVDILKKMRNNCEYSNRHHEERNISDFIIIDRWLDPLTPLFIQLTYGGLIDEILKIGPSGNIKSTLFTKESNSNELVETNLKDDLFFVLRDQHIKDVGKCTLQIISNIRDERKNLKENPGGNSLAENKVVVRRLIDVQKSEKNVDTHTTIASHLMTFIRDNMRFSKLPQLELDIVQGYFGDRVIPFIEDLIIEAYEPKLILRLIAIQSLVSGGLKTATFNAYQRLFIQTFGIYNLTLWLKLQLMGLISERTSKIKCNYLPFDFAFLNRKLAYSSDERSSNEYSYIYGEYIPFLVRYIEIGAKDNWKDWTTITSFDEAESSPDSFIVVFIVGGITMAEMACLRRIKFSNPVVIISTSLTNGNLITQPL